MVILPKLLAKLRALPTKVIYPERGFFRRHKTMGLPAVTNNSFQKSVVSEGYIQCLIVVTAEIVRVWAGPRLADRQLH
jgi:hypothetical protein